MWNYMTTNKGQHRLSHGEQRIYVKAGGIGSDEHDQKEKAVRKVVRALIENEGGDGEKIKEKIDAKYRWGPVWWQLDSGKWQKIAQWNEKDKMMTLMKEGQKLQTAFDKLME